MPADCRELRSFQSAALVRQANDPGEMREASRAVQSAYHAERRLVAVQPGEERDARLVVEGRFGEDLAGERLGRLEDAADA